MNGNGNDATELLAHELLHIWFDDIFIGPGSGGTSSNMPRGFNQTFTGTATVVLNGSPLTLTFSWTGVLNDQGRYAPTAGYGAFEHMVIHNILINTYHHDVGALGEALDFSDLHLTRQQKAAILSAYGAAPVPVTGTFNMPPTAARCGAGAASIGRARRTLDDPTMGSTFNVDYVMQ